MKQNELTKHLNDNQFHLDPLGRMVIDDPELLAAINGAMSDTSALEELLHNGACANSSCG